MIFFIITPFYKQGGEGQNSPSAPCGYGLLLTGVDSFVGNRQGIAINIEDLEVMKQMLPKPGQ